MTKLAKKLKNLPDSPGAYIFKDRSGRILYIGKAISLKKRVKSHFAKNGGVPYRDHFIDKISDIDWMLADNESQAFLLENQLIKKFRPRYNIQWRDDKSYFWVAFTKEEWPRVQVVHENKLARHPELVSGSETKMSKQVRHDILEPIGPFTSGNELRAVLRSLRRILPYRTCKNPAAKPCLQWHLGLCPAHGNNETECAKAKKKYLASLETLRQFLLIYAGEPVRIEAYDISNIHGNWATGSMIVFKGSKPDKSNYRRFKIKTVRGSNDVAMMKEILRRRATHPEWAKPGLMLIDGGKGQLGATKAIPGFAPAVSLAKREEEIYTEYSEKSLKLGSLPQDLKLAFQAIRNEAHRFAIFYYRHLHRKNIKK